MNLRLTHSNRRNVWSSHENDGAHAPLIHAEMLKLSLLVLFSRVECCGSHKDSKHLNQTFPGGLTVHLRSQRPHQMLSCTLDSTDSLCRGSRLPDLNHMGTYGNVCYQESKSQFSAHSCICRLMCHMLNFRPPCLHTWRRPARRMCSFIET